MRARRLWSLVGQASLWLRAEPGSIFLLLTLHSLPQTVHFWKIGATGLPYKEPLSEPPHEYDPNRLLQRFLRYVQIDTTAQPDAAGYPSSAGQLELGRLLTEELLELGLKDARQNEHGIVFATLPATVAGKAPTIAFCSHLDTSPETSGANIKPQILKNYQGGDIVLPGDPKKVIRVADNPLLDSLKGRTIITTDGTTLLGADDKAGVAIIVETAAWLLEHPGDTARASANLFHLRRRDRPRRR